MSRDELVKAGAFALYRAEHSHRIEEFCKSSNSDELIQTDFEHFRGKYLRKFEDFAQSLAAEGLAILPAV